MRVTTIFRHYLLFALLGLVSLAGNRCAVAQLSSATVTGLVRDLTGASVPGAKAMLVNSDSNVSRETTSNESGNYTFNNVPPGRYTMQLSAPSFAAQKIDAFELSVNQTLSLNVNLNAGDVQTVVSVDAQGTQVESSTAELGGLIGEKSVHDLPLNGRNFTALLTLTPGVVPISVGQNQTASNTAVAAGSTFVFPSVNGQGNRANYFLIDGMNDQQAWYNTYAIAPIVDSIQEFKVNSHNDAQFGQVTGGVINVATKSGGNQLHGAAWEYLRNTAFNAKTYPLATVTPFHENQFGGVLGGPVRIPRLYDGRNKTFFFIGAEGFHYSQNANASTYNVPTKAEIAGDFSALLPNVQLYNPATGLPFLNNNLAGSLDPGAVAYSKLVIPAPVVISGVTANNVVTGANRQTQWNYTGRIDENIGSRDFIFFRYSGQELDKFGPTQLIGLASLTQVPSQAYGASWTHILSPSSSFQLLYARSHVEYNVLTTFGSPNVANTYGLDPSLGSFIGGQTLMPTINILGYFSAGESSNPTPNLSSAHEYKGTFLKTIGRHGIQAGGSWDQLNYTALLRNATLTFAPGQTSGAGSVGDGFASFLLGYPSTATKRNIMPTERPGGIASIYIQDSWKITPKLTANYGLRYDRTFIPAYGQENTDGQQGGIDTGDFDFNNGTYILQKVPQACSTKGVAPCIPGTGALPAGVVVSPTTKILHPTKTNFGPRLGLAYSVNPSLAIRGSFGIFFDNWAAAIQLPQNYQGSWPDVATLGTGAINARSAGKGVTNYVSPHNPFGSAAALLPGATPFTANNNFYIDPNIKNPYSEQWNIGIQQQFGGNTVFTLNYVGSEGHRTDIGGYYNVGQPSLTKFGDPSRARQVGINGPQPNGQPYGNIQPVQSWDRSAGSAHYHALQASVARSLRNGFAYTASYTWSKSIDYGQSGNFGSEGNQLNNPYDLRGSKGVSAFNLPHVASVSVVYDLPVGTGKRFSTKNRYADYILGNWQLNTIFVGRSGNNYTLVASGDTANVGNPGTATSIGQGYYARALLTGINPHVDHPTAQRWFNTAAFAVPGTAGDPTLGLGNAGRNVYAAQTFTNVDLSVIRSFPIRDNVALDFRAEAFNVLNEVIFGNPGLVVNIPTTFGIVAGQGGIGSRQLQFAAKLHF